MGDSLIALSGKDFVLIAADASVAPNIMVLKGDEDKIYEMDGDKLLAVQGEAADRIEFAGYTVRNTALHYYRTGHSLTPRAAAAWVQTELAKAIREDPYQVRCFIAGVEKGAAHLYAVDGYGAMQKLNYGAQGYAQYLVLGILDRYWREDLNLEQAEQLLGMCVDHVKRRLALNNPRHIVKAVTPEGIKVRPLMEGGQMVPPTRPFHME